MSVGSAYAISQSGEQKDMRRVGHVDLQGRSAYQPNVITYPDGRVIAFVGTHGGNLPNPLKPGSPVEPNGTMIIDITNPAKPKEIYHIPGSGGTSQMVRPCLGSQLGAGSSSSVYLMRNFGQGYQVYDVSDPKAPALLSTFGGMRSTHKMWWECSTGIAYLPGSLNKPVGDPARWRQAQSMVIVDWHDPSNPQYVRTYGLPGTQPDGTGVVPPSLHGPISAHDHPDADKLLARGQDVIGNRLYLAWGVGDDGVLQILDRKKVLPPSLGGTWTGDPDRPTDDDLLSPQVGILHTSPDQGGHTSMPVFGLQPKSYGCFKEFQTRDIVLLASEATANRCNEAPHWSFIVDVTVENSKSVPPGTKVEANVWQGPMVLATMSVDPRAGEKYPRGNYCTRGARFGVHSSEENFRNPYYGRLTFLAYFTGGVRAWDIREPQAPVEVGFYVGETNANASPAGFYMTNNLEVDDRGYIIAVDRSSAGMDILELHGKAREIGLGLDKHSREQRECVNDIPPGGGGGGGG